MCRGTLDCGADVADGSSGGWEADVGGGGGGGGSSPARAVCMATMLRLSTSMLAPIRATTPAKAFKVSGAPDDSEISDCTVEGGSVAAAETPEVGRGVIIGPEVSDTKLLGFLALSERDRRL